MNEARRKEQYVCKLISIVLPDRDFEMTTMSPNLGGNRIGGLRTHDIYALLGATLEQQSAAWAAVFESEKQIEQWHEDREKQRQPMTYPY